MYSTHQELKQASKQASKQATQPRHNSLVSTEAFDKFVVFEESVCAPRVRVRASVLLVLERVLPAVPGLIVAQESDERRRRRRRRSSLIIACIACKRTT